MRNFELPKTKTECLERAGSMSQFAGVSRSVWQDGRARGVEALDFRTGGGLEFTVLPGRGMDIARASYRGVPLAFVTKAGYSAAENYEPEGLGWLRNFFAGLLTTCGLQNVGDPCEEDDYQLGCVKYGLHGRISNTGADNVTYESRWVSDGLYRLSASGRMREAQLHGENLTLTRRIRADMGEKRLFIEDTVENEGFTPREIMLLYHINPGYPVLSEHSEFIAPSMGVVPGTPAAEAAPGSFNEFAAPALEAEQFVYNHNMASLGGRSQAALVNRELELGLYVRYYTDELPYFAQWKRLSKGDYVVGMEPGNAMSVGRDAMRRTGRMKTLAPGEKTEPRLEIGVLDGEREISAFRRETEEILHGSSARL